MPVRLDLIRCDAMRTDLIVKVPLDLDQMRSGFGSYVADGWHARK
jgi:hypothetical protein